jgi:hypothetical protein
MTETEKVMLALEHLRHARDLLRNAPKAQNKVRLAITSCDGALRHAQHRDIRREIAENEVSAHSE